MNVLTVLAVGDEMTLFINSHEIGTICDKSSDSGAIGLIAAAYKGTTEVVYGNLKVWELG